MNPVSPDSVIEMPPSQSFVHGARITLLGLVVNVLLVATKLTAGIVGRSYALIADAVESSLDIFSSFVVWHGLRIAAKPADAEHPYGHGRAEALAAMFTAMTLIGAGVGIAIGAVHELRAPQSTPAPYTLVVLLAVVAVKETMFRLARRVAADIGSAAIGVDSWHHRSDALTSAVAAVGIALPVLGGERYSFADEGAALVAAGFIITNAARLLRQPMRELMDEQPAGIVSAARAVAARVDGVADIEKILARKSGLQYLIDMHVEVDPRMTVLDAHDVAHRVKGAVQRELPAVLDVLVHIEPHGLPRG